MRLNSLIEKARAKNLEGFESYLEFLEWYSDQNYMKVPFLEETDKQIFKDYFKDKLAHPNWDAKQLGGFLEERFKPKENFEIVDALDFFNSCNDQEVRDNLDFIPHSNPETLSRVLLVQEGKYIFQEGFFLVDHIFDGGIVLSIFCWEEFCYFKSAGYNRFIETVRFNWHLGSDIEIDYHIFSESFNLLHEWLIDLLNTSVQGRLKNDLEEQQERNKLRIVEEIFFNDLLKKDPLLNDL